MENTIKFSTEVKKCSAYNLGMFVREMDDNLDYNQFPSKVDWTLELDVRKDGLNSAIITIDSVKAEIEWERIVVVGEEEKDGIVSVDSNIELKGKRWNVVKAFHFNEFGNLSIEDVEIDFNRMVITIS